MRIDVHAHAWTERYLELVASEGPALLGPNLAFVRDLGGLATSSDLGERFALMDEVDVDLQVLSPGGLDLYSEDETRAVRLARLSNDNYAELAGRHPDRFRAFAGLPLPHVDAALTELERALGELGMAGITMLTSILGRSPADPSFAPVWEELDRREAVVFLHPAGVAACSAQIKDLGLSWVLGAPVEDTVCAAHLVFSGVPSRYPGARIVIPHLGGALAMLLARFDDQPGPLRAPDLPELPSVAAKRMWYDIVSNGHVPALRCAVESLGADRLLLGTDFPFQRSAGFRNAVRHVGDAGLDSDTVRRILDRNATELFHRVIGVG